jgi:hypothetical protein
MNSQDISYFNEHSNTKLILNVNDHKLAIRKVKLRLETFERSKKEDVNFRYVFIIIN